MTDPPISFAAVQELGATGWTTLRGLHGRDQAQHVARAGKRPRRVVGVDLRTGWTERAPDHLVHESGGEVQLSTFEVDVWRYMAPHRVVWDKTRAGHWYARWAALAYAVVEPG
mgnify:CR=1 FL=1